MQDEQEKLEAHPLGANLHTFVTKQRRKKGSKRAYEFSGAGGAVLVPVGLTLVEGTLGIIVAVVGGLVALSAYWLATRGVKRPAPLTIEVFEKGIVCSQGQASREILWNEVIEITNKAIETPDGTPSLALVFETVGAPPLIIMVGGKFSDESETSKLLSSLQKAWIPIWCRRARVLAQHEPVRVGRASIGCDCVTVDGRKLAWSAITGVHEQAGRESLETLAGVEKVEESGKIQPFPSAARRIASLAQSPPEPLFLPSGQVEETKHT